MCGYLKAVTLGRCFQFYFYMEGDPEWSGQLHVYLKSPSSNIEDLNPIWLLAGSQGGEWNLYQLSTTLVTEYEVLNN